MRLLQAAAKNRGKPAEHARNAFFQFTPYSVVLHLIMFNSGFYAACDVSIPHISEFLP